MQTILSWRSKTKKGVCENFKRRVLFTLIPIVIGMLETATPGSDLRGRGRSFWGSDVERQNDGQIVECANGFPESER